jgi:hypothetical protein
LHLTDSYYSTSKINEPVDDKRNKYDNGKVGIGFFQQTFPANFQSNQGYSIRYLEKNKAKKYRPQSVIFETFGKLPTGDRTKRMRHSAQRTVDPQQMFAHAMQMPLKTENRQPQIVRHTGYRYGDNNNANYKYRKVVELHI